MDIPFLCPGSDVWCLAWSMDWFVQEYGKLPPKLSYTIHITTTVASNFKSNFLRAGINQVLHQIILTVSLECDLGMTDSETEQIITTDFIIAQTVIVGAVPDAFTSVVHATDEMMEDIFDFGAQVSN